jgi:tetratricopeptide (TPR) repeat protein/tRNA A-37 threonylcarbamoyl transferase component Bud32
VKATERLIDVVAAVSDGAVLDWDRIESEAAPADRHLVGHLRLLERVASVHSALPPVAAFERSLHDSLRHPAAVAEAPRVDTPARWGPLTIVERIGSGTYADVYRARDPRLDRPVALKLLRHRAGAGRAVESEAIEEARLLARIRHPNVVTVYGAERIDGRVGIWMELVDGQTLEQELRNRGPFAAQELVDVGTALCRALGAVHAAGLLHRDVKAQNVMRDRDGRVLLTDFGTGRELADLAAARELAGTPLYLAPEVLNGAPASMTSDVYSLGVLLYHLATTSFPVSGRSLRDLSDAHARGIHVPLQEARPALPKRLATVIDRAAAADVGERYESARAFETALIGAMDPRRTWRRTPLAAVAIGTAILALSGGYVATHWTGRTTVPFQARDWVLVTTFDNRTGEKQFDRVLEHVLTYELSDSSYVNVVPPERVDDALRLMARPVTTVVDAATGPAVALRDGGIRLVLDGEIDRRGSAYAMTVRLVDPHSTGTLARDREDAPTTADVLLAMRRLSTWIRLRLGEAPDTVTRDNAQAGTPSFRAIGDYAEALHAFNLGRRTEAEGLLGSALSEDPSFASAHIWMAWAKLNLGQPRDVYLKSAHRAVDLMGTATERERYWILGSYYLMTKQDQLAIAQYEALTSRYPDSTWALHNLEVLYRRTGRSQDAVNMPIRIANSRPSDFATQVLAAQALLGANGRDAARPFVARAQMLVSTASDTFNGGVGALKSWVLAFPAYDLWVQGRGKEAAAALDAASRRPEFDAEGPWALNILGQSRLALGQVQLAEAAFARLTGGQRDVAMSEVALARNDLPAITEHLRSHRTDDGFTMSLLVRAGDVGAADRLFRTTSFEFLNPTRAGWAAAEIAEARGDYDRTTEALKGDLPWIRELNGSPRAFLYSETLARAAVATGNIGGAIRVLEAAGAVSEKALTPVGHSGSYWIRTQKLLADLYRQTGQVDKARSIERHLLATLSAADDDYPLLVELKAMGGQ